MNYRVDLSFIESAKWNVIAFTTNAVRDFFVVVVNLAEALYEISFENYVTRNTNCFLKIDIEHAQIGIF